MNDPRSRIRVFAPGNTRALALLALSRGLGALVALAIPLLAGSLLGGLVERTGAQPGLLLALLVAALAGLAVLNIASGMLSARVAARVERDLRSRIFAKQLRLPLAWHQAGQRGERIALIEHDAPRVARFLTETLVPIPAHLVLLAGALAAMAWIDPLLALIAALLVPLFYLVMRWLGRRLRPLGHEVQRLAAALTARVAQMLALIAPLKAFGQQATQEKRFRQLNEAEAETRLREEQIYAALDPAINFIVVAGFLAGIFFADSERVGDAAALITLLLYAGLLTRPVAALSRVYGQMQSTAGAAERLHEVLEAPDEPEGGHPLVERSAGAIAVADLSFGYAGRPPLFERLNAHFPSGATTLIAGPNGAGKSTLLKLLLRFAEPAAGRILLDDRDIAGLNLADLRRQFGYVEQDPALMAASLRDNIRFGREIGDEALEHAVRQAGLKEFVASLPTGLDTRIGEDGVWLSGGQRQRVAIARTLAGDPPILLLDEATAMLDADSELAFLDTCRRELGGRTLIVISHRDTVRRFADHVVTLGPPTRIP